MHASHPPLITFIRTPGMNNDKLRDKYDKLKGDAMVLQEYLRRMCDYFNKECKCGN